MNGVVRRRAISKKEELIEKPDCVRIDVTTTVDAYSFRFGYYVGNSKVSYVELDGERIEWTRGESNGFIIPNAGKHVIYIKPSGTWPSNHMFGYFANCDYIRFPYNAASTMLCDISKQSSSGSWKKIDILDENVLSQVKKNTYSTFSSAYVIRVPIGTKQLYANAGVSQSILNKMVEYNFKYEI